MSRSATLGSAAENTLRADSTHGGIQLVVPLIMAAAGAILFFILDPLVLRPLLNSSEWDTLRPLLRVVLSVVLGVAAGGGAEALLKRTWGSGRQLQLSPSGLSAEIKGERPRRIVWEKRVNLLWWRYPLRGYTRGGRERQIPTGHLMLACRMLQDDESVVVHCYLSPRRAETLPGYDRFESLDMAELYGSRSLRAFSQPKRPAIPAALYAGKQGRLWAAEKERWQNGLELDPVDFSTLLEALGQYATTPS